VILPRKLRIVFAILVALVGLTIPLLLFLADRKLSRDPIDIAKAFYKASYARDFAAAYAHVSAVDRKILDQPAYIYGEGSLSGFARELAKRFADQAEFQVVEREIDVDRARVALDYKVPASDQLSALLLNWDQDKLNTLPHSEQQRIIDALGKLEKDPTRISIEGRETFNLIKENGRWKIFLDWASGINVSFDAALPVHNALEVEFLKREIFTSKDEPFQSNLKIRNRSQREIVARIDHRIEPKEFASHITMVACGFLSPLTLRPGEEREVSSAYLLDSDFPRNTKLSIAYKFNLESPSHTLR
jgi:hypothetical protein